jgi:hypothetical protein
MIIDNSCLGLANTRCTCTQKKFFSKSFKLSKKLHFSMKLYSFWFKNKMCKAHFHRFAVIISPFHAMGVKISKQKFKKLFSPKQGAPTFWATQQGAPTSYGHPNGVLAPR